MVVTKLDFYNALTYSNGRTFSEVKQILRTKNGYASVVGAEQRDFELGFGYFRTIETLHELEREGYVWSEKAGRRKLYYKIRGRPYPPPDTEDDSSIDSKII